MIPATISTTDDGIGSWGTSASTSGIPTASTITSISSLYEISPTIRVGRYPRCLVEVRADLQPLEPTALA